MAKIHMVLQGKGGVGKSFVAAMIAQYKVSKGQAPLCIDTDPVNSTFHGYKALNVVRLRLLNGEEIDSRNFDALIELVAETKSDVVVDNGAVSFMPMAHYLLINDVAATFERFGHELVIHTVITGGQALSDTVNGFAQLVKKFAGEAQFVIWLNPYWGPIEHAGLAFEEMKAYRANRNRIAAIVQIPTLKHETFGRDLREMLEERLTFDEALAMPSRTIMTRQRLKMVQRDLFGEIDTAAVV